MTSTLHHCPCCGYRTLAESPPGTFDVCPVYYWEDDDVQWRDTAYAGGANVMSLSVARQEFLEHGVIAPEYSGLVRPPNAFECRPWRPWQANANNDTEMTEAPHRPDASSS